MNLIDRYLVKQFFQIFFFGLIAFTLIFVVIDLMENLDDFIDHDVPGKIIAEYYLYFIPEIIRLMIPVATLLSALFTVGRMANLNELAAIKATGMSLYRFMIPFIATALVISIFTIGFGGFIVPKANKNKVFIEVNYMKKDVFFSGSNIFFQDDPGRIVNIGYYDVNNMQGNRVSIQEFSPRDITTMTSRIDASRIKYDTVGKFWTAHNVAKRTFDGKSEKLQKSVSMELDYLNFLPKDVVIKQQKPEEMNLFELWDFIQSQLKSGNDPTRDLIEFHSRFSFAMASFVVVIFGIPLSANKRRGGLALQFGINLTITFIYLGFMKISQAFGKNGVMDPVLTAWFANILFFVAALVNLFRARK